MEHETATCFLFVLILTPHGAEEAHQPWAGPFSECDEHTREYTNHVVSCFLTLSLLFRLSGSAAQARSFSDPPHLLAR